MKQIDLFNQHDETSNVFKVKDGEYIFIEHFFDTDEAKSYFDLLLKSIVWKQEKMVMYGKELMFPRLTAWYGDSDKPYTFSGITLKPNDWTNELLQIKKKIEVETEIIFNSVLLNRYRNGNDSISWHTDAEKELGENPVIASVNFGASRKFQLKHITTKERIDIELTNGSLLIMQGPLQHYWKHQVPKTKKKIGERINLTFRVIK